MPFVDEDKKIPFDIHTEHHRWIESKKEGEKLANDRAEKVKTSVASSILIAIILGIASIVIEYFKGGK